jgi:hypothetical protein
MRISASAGAVTFGTLVWIVVAPNLPTGWAAPSMDGVYTAQYAAGGNSVWTVHSSCNPSGCYAHVASDQGWARDAQYMDQRWVMDWIGRPDGMVCADGTAVPATDHWWWDAESLAGEFSASHGAGCGNPPTAPGQVSSPFRLVRR